MIEEMKRANNRRVFVCCKEMVIIMKNSLRRSRNPANILAGRNLKYFMDVNQISEEQLAESFGIEKDSLQRILNGRNAISGQYNYILRNEYHCDLNFIYGDVENCDIILKDISQIEGTDARMKKQDAIVRGMRYLAELLENL